MISTIRVSPWVSHLNSGTRVAHALARFFGSSLDDRGLVGNTAVVAAHTDIDVSVDAPIGIPRITNDPVRFGSLLVVADGLHAVVELLLAAPRHDALLVVLPGLGIHAHRDWALARHRSGHLVLGA